MNLDNLEITWGVKCYNGAFDSRTDAAFRAQDHVFKELKKIVPGLSITYFPAEAKYMAFVNHFEISGWFHSRAAALIGMYELIVDKQAVQGVLMHEWEVRKDNIIVKAGEPAEFIIKESTAGWYSNGVKVPGSFVRRSHE